MIPLGFSGGSQDRLMVLAVAAIRWTVGTADGAAQSKSNKTQSFVFFFFFCVCLFKSCSPCVPTDAWSQSLKAVGFVKRFGQ